MLVAGFDLATGFLPGALVREYGSRTSTEAGGHRRGASCIGSTVLRAPEVLVRCGAHAHGPPPHPPPREPWPHAIRRSAPLAGRREPGAARAAQSPRGMEQRARNAG